MNIWVTFLLSLLALQFVVLFRGAPYLPTRHRQRVQALDLLGLKSGQTLLDLGCGDGAMLIAAAERGIIAVGYEINPLLVVAARLRTRKYGQKTSVKWGNFWNARWPEADGIFVFLSNTYMKRLDTRLRDLKKQRPIRLVTYAFPVPGRRPTKRSGALYLYHY